MEKSTILPLLTVCLISVFGSVSGWNGSEQLLGIKMASKAIRGICWYERYKRPGLGKISGSNDCSLPQNFEKDIDPDSTSQYDGSKELLDKFRPVIVDALVQMQFPSEFKEQCSPLIDNYEAEPQTDESDLLCDERQNYPFKAFAYCLLNVLEKIRGASAIKALEEEILIGRKNWMVSLLDRQNEHRKMHGVSSLRMAPRLIADAQKYAEQLAKECQLRHSETSNRIHPTGGKAEGENVHSGKYNGELGEKALAGYRAANNWYSEEKDYPFEKGTFDGKDDEILSRVEHFTQTVWAGSKFVGYGFARNLDCEKQGKNTGYLVARYFPPGNKPGKFDANVVRRMSESGGR